jgi:hypothetical protein
MEKYAHFHENSTSEKFKTRQLSTFNQSTGNIRQKFISIFVDDIPEKE